MGKGRTPDAASGSAELVFDSALGRIRLRADSRGLTRIELPGGKFTEEFHAKKVGAGHPLLAEAVQQLTEYLAGQRTNFSLPLAPAGTPFQLRVWEVISIIPYGQTMTYESIAQLLGNRGLSRAVGRAAGANPLPLVIPCHRVIGADGRLTGFACGLEMKEKLLKLEEILLTDHHHTPAS